MGRIFNIFVATFASLGSFLFGYDSGIIATVLAMPQFLDKFNPNANILGAVASTFNGGCFVGAAIAGWTNDKLGRKLTIQIGALVAILGCALQAGANSVGMLLAGRIIGGIAIGILSMTVPLYNTEIAPPTIRGFVVGLTQQMLGIGFIVANWVGYGCAYLSSAVSWRLPLALQIVPAACLLVGIQFLPNSPRWLLEVGRDAEAEAVVHQLHGSSPAAKESAAIEYAEMHDYIKAENLTRSRRYSDLWATRPMLRRTLVGVGVQVFTQFTGINVINYFGPTIYKSLGIVGHKGLLVQSIYGAIGPVANLFFIIFVLDRVGRKKPLQFGAATFIVTYSILSAIIARETGEHANESAERAAVAIIFLTSVVFSLSFGPVSWVLASEVFPTKTRSIGTSVATCANWAFNTLLSQVSPLGMAQGGWKFYLLFIFLNLMDLILITIFFPETKGRTLEEMDIVFGDHIDSQRVLEERGEKHLAGEHTHDGLAHGGAREGYRGGDLQHRDEKLQGSDEFVEEGRR